MVKKTQSGSVQAQMEDVIRAEAMRIARANQVPGQTKEESKLIAKGIAKGIAEYKRQEKSKQRDRAKQLKKQRRVTNAADHPTVEDAENFQHDFNPNPGFTAAGIFLMIALLQWVTAWSGYRVAIGAFIVDPIWLNLAAFLMTLVAIWVYRWTRGQSHWFASCASSGSATQIEADN